MPTQAASSADLIEHAERLAADAPPLTAEQRDRLAVLLRPARERFA